MFKICTQIRRVNPCVPANLTSENYAHLTSYTHFVFLVFFAFFFTGPRRSYLTGPRRKGWTETEIIALKAGVKRHGIGNWVDVLRDRDFGPHLRGAYYSIRIVGISRKNISKTPEIIGMRISQTI